MPERYNPIRPSIRCRTQVNAVPATVCSKMRLTIGRCHVLEIFEGLAPAIFYRFLVSDSHRDWKRFQRFTQEGAEPPNVPNKAHLVSCPSEHPFELVIAENTPSVPQAVYCPTCGVKMMLLLWEGSSCWLSIRGDATVIAGPECVETGLII